MWVIEVHIAALRKNEWLFPCRSLRQEMFFWGYIRFLHKAEYIRGLRHNCQVILRIQDFYHLTIQSKQRCLNYFWKNNNMIMNRERLGAKTNVSRATRSDTQDYTNCSFLKCRRSRICINLKVILQVDVRLNKTWTYHMKAKSWQIDRLLQCHCTELNTSNEYYSYKLVGW
jgi:hypothetical protein